MLSNNFKSKFSDLKRFRFNIDSSVVVFIAVSVRPLPVLALKKSIYSIIDLRVILMFRNGGLH